MATPRREPEVPRGARPESPLARGVRLRGTPTEARLTGFGRVPRSAAGGAVGLGVVVLFFASLAGNPLRFLGLLLLAGSVLALAVLALVLSPIRAEPDRRWRPRRRIAPLDTAGWDLAASRLGARRGPGRLPSVAGSLRGIAYRLAYLQRGGARTEAAAIAPAAVTAPLVLFPRRAAFASGQDFFTGDGDFDREWHVLCARPATARLLLSPEARRWITAVRPEEVRVTGRTVVVRLPAFRTDADLLVGLVRAAVEVAGGAAIGFEATL